MRALYQEMKMKDRVAKQINELVSAFVEAWEATPPSAEAVATNMIAVENGVRQPSYLRWGGTTKVARGHVPYAAQEVALMIAYKRMGSRNPGFRFDEPKLYRSPDEVWGWVKEGVGQ